MPIKVDKFHYLYLPRLFVFVNYHTMIITWNQGVLEYNWGSLSLAFQNIETFVDNWLYLQQSELLMELSGNRLKDGWPIGQFIQLGRVNLFAR